MRLNANVAVPLDLAGRYANGAWSFHIVKTNEGLEFHGRTSPAAAEPISARVVSAGKDRVALVLVNDSTHRTTYVPVAVLRDSADRVKYLYLGERAARRQ